MASKCSLNWPLGCKHYAASQVSEKLQDRLVGEGGVNAQSAQFLRHQYAPMILHIVVSANPVTALLSATTCVSHHHGESQILQKFTSKF